MDLTDKVAIVTGAGQGIGRAIALRLAGAGATVVIAELNRKVGEAVAKEIEALGRKSLVIEVDVSKLDQTQRMAQQTLEAFNQIDILVNNAGIAGRTATLPDLEESDWDAVIDVNLKGVFLCCKAVIDHMIERQYGKIVSVASIAGKEGNPTLIPVFGIQSGRHLSDESLGKGGHRVQHQRQLCVTGGNPHPNSGTGVAVHHRLYGK